MDDILRALADRRGGYFFRRDFIEAGGCDADLRLARRAKLLTRLRHGTYALAGDIETMSPEQRHILLARSVATHLGPAVALSHHSAALVHGGAAYRLDLEVVHVTRLDGRQGRQEAGVVYHVGELNDSDLIETGGTLVTRPERAAFESATLASMESGLVTVNSLAHSGVCLQAMWDVAQRLERWQGGRKARLVLRLAEPGCETVGESRSFFVFWRGGVPRPDVQVHIADRDGVEIARSDFGWLERGYVGEFDGMVKYGRLNPYSGADLGQVLVDEKRREDLIRAQGLGVLRWTWADLEPWRRAEFVARVKDALDCRRVYPAA